MPLEAMATYTVDYTGIPGHVYTLLLESGCFYVAWSSAVENRIAQHFSGAGSKWTMQHKPLQVLACVAGDTRLEDVVTISLMCQHGWERVRGGRWCQLALEGPPDAVTRAMPPQEPRPEPCSGPAETDVGPCSASQDNAQSGAPERMQEEQREERETASSTHGALKSGARKPPQSAPSEGSNASMGLRCKRLPQKCPTGGRTARSQLSRGDEPPHGAYQTDAWLCRAQRWVGVSMPRRRKAVHTIRKPIRLASSW